MLVGVCLRLTTVASRDGNQARARGPSGLDHCDSGVRDAPRTPIRGGSTRTGPTHAANVTITRHSVTHRTSRARRDPGEVAVRSTSQFVWMGCRGFQSPSPGLPCFDVVQPLDGAGQAAASLVETQCSVLSLVTNKRRDREASRAGPRPCRAIARAGRRISPTRPTQSVRAPTKVPPHRSRPGRGDPWAFSSWPAPQQRMMGGEKRPPRLGVQGPAGRTSITDPVLRSSMPPGYQVSRIVPTAAARKTSARPPSISLIESLPVRAWQRRTYLVDREGDPCQGTARLTRRGGPLHGVQRRHRQGMAVGSDMTAASALERARVSYSARAWADAVADFAAADSTNAA